ncbi:MAG: ABC transporter permease [Ktedonobacteraceae bacterium]|nr:ABC transporter permease [Ktedonobacteraceae bacterium]
MDKLYQFIVNPSNDYLGHTLTYIGLCLASTVLAIMIGVVLGAAVSRNPLLAFIAVNISGLMRAIPIIAFLVAVLPYLGLGFLPAMIALTVLGIPPILLNTYTGIRGISPAIIDAAKGIGMTTGQIITKIQAPLVLPIIAAGVRTSTVQIIATATLAAIISAGGYGEYILSGLYQLDDVQILAGAIPVAILALIAEVLLSQLQRALTPAGLRVREVS